MYALHEWEEEPEDRRFFQQAVCRELNFTNLSFHGPVTTDTVMPGRFTVGLVPASLNRLIDAYHGVLGGIGITGVQLRCTDVVSDMAGLKVKDPRLMLRRNGEGFVCELMAFCEDSGCCFLGELLLGQAWFESNGDRKLSVAS